MDEDAGTRTKRGIDGFFKAHLSASLMEHSPTDEIFARLTSIDVQLLRPTPAERTSVVEGFKASKEFYKLNNSTESQNAAAPEHHV